MEAAGDALLAAGVMDLPSQIAQTCDIMDFGHDLGVKCDVTPRGVVLTRVRSWLEGRRELGSLLALSAVRRGAVRAGS